MERGKTRTVSPRRRRKSPDYGIVDLSREFWLRRIPHKNRNIEKLNKEFWTARAAANEREVRIELMRSSALPIDKKVADVLERAADGKPASVGCCPLLARQFQLFFVDEALRIHANQDLPPQKYTLLNPIDRARYWQLDDIDCRKLHARLRRRLGAVFGRDVVAFGICELSYVERHRQWQPHYHIVIYGPGRRFKRLRTRYYTRWTKDKETKAKKKNNTWLGVTVRQMVKSNYPSEEFPKWLSYTSKLNAFSTDKDSGGRPVYKRLPDDASRAFFRYLARRRPTSFIFCMNCRIAKRRRM